MAQFGKVIGQFKTRVVDSLDADQNPDLVPLTGFVDFLANVARATDSTDPVNPVTLGTSTITALVDASGVLSTPSLDGGTTAQYVGIFLPATDDPAISPHTNVAYTVTYRLKDPQGRAVAIPSHLLAVPLGTVVDLAYAIPPVGSPVQSLAAAEASAAAAAVSAAQAVANSLTFIVLNAGQSVPPGTPANTVIIRKA